MAALQEPQVSKFDTLWARIEAEIPGVRILPKASSRLMRAIAFFLGSSFLSIYDTTIGRTVYVGSTFNGAEDSGYARLRHELVHLRQFRGWPIAALARPYLWTINAILMSIAYLLIAPVRWTLRARLERAAYLQELLAEHELGHLVGNEKYFAELMVAYFSTSRYAWMSSAAVARAWANQAIEDIKAGRVSNERDRVQ